MKILSFDTTNIKPSISLFEDGEILDLIIIEENAKPAELMIVKIEEILDSNEISYDDLDAISFCKGPASFTSVRIGLAIAKTLALTLNIEFFSFDSLLTIAQKYQDFSGPITVLVDAKMQEFFYAEFYNHDNKIEVIQNSQLIQLQDLDKINLHENMLICGSGKELLFDIAQKQNINPQISDENDKFSADILAIMAFNKMSLGIKGDRNFMPDYLRNPKIGVRKS